MIAMPQTRQAMRRHAGECAGMCRRSGSGQSDTSERPRRRRSAPSAERRRGRRVWRPEKASGRGFAACGDGHGGSLRRRSGTRGGESACGSARSTPPRRRRGRTIPLPSSSAELRRSPTSRCRRRRPPRSLLTFSPSFPASLRRRRRKRRKTTGPIRPAVTRTTSAPRAPSSAIRLPPHHPPPCP